MAETLEFRAPKLGIGMTYTSALRPFLEARPDALDLLELEPQTLWLADHPINGPFAEFEPALEAFTQWAGHKLVHSVGVPLGGTRRPDAAQTKLVRETAERVGSPWVSEHLSVAGTPHIAAGFLLPPLQTEEGLENATNNILSFAKGVQRPVAVETGVAYFRCKDFEMSDGEFLSRVAEAANCGLLLDLHNLFCNHMNGRIDFDETLFQIPFDRVWEVHLAGGDEFNGFWLDSHSGEMPDELAGRAVEVISELNNLGAINFEIYDTFLQRLDLAEFDRISDQLRELWSRAGKTRSDPRPLELAILPNAMETPDRWEQGMTNAVWKADASLHKWEEDQEGLTLYSFLARSFRGSILARALPRTIRYGLLRDGHDYEQDMQVYFNEVSPQIFAPLESIAFRDWVLAKGENDPLMLSLMDFDIAFILLLSDRSPKVVKFPGDPGPVFEALAEGRLPACPRPPEWEFEILPDEATVQKFTPGSLHS